MCPILKTERIGETSILKGGLIGKIVTYTNCDNVGVLILDTNEFRSVTYQNFKKGSVKSKYAKTIHGVGYLGEYDSTVDKDGNLYRSYSIWEDMIERCYKNDKSSRKKSYIDCMVDDSWHDYSVFKKWYDSNYYTIEGEKIDLDKDIIVKGNKIYSSNNCIFVPSRINVLFTKAKAKRGNLPIGVTQNRSNSYQARMSVKENYSKNLGFFKTPEEAFLKYKQEKEKYIKKVADEYKNRIPLKLYNAMYSYKIDITD